MLTLLGTSYGSRGIPIAAGIFVHDMVPHSDLAARRGSQVYRDSSDPSYCPSDVPSEAGSADGRLHPRGGAGTKWVASSIVLDSCRFLLAFYAKGVLGVTGLADFHINLSSNLATDFRLANFCSILPINLLPRTRFTSPQTQLPVAANCP